MCRLSIGYELTKVWACNSYSFPFHFSCVKSPISFMPVCLISSQTGSSYHPPLTITGSSSDKGSSLTAAVLSALSRMTSRGVARPSIVLLFRKCRGVAGQSASGSIVYLGSYQLHLFIRQLYLVRLGSIVYKNRKKLTLVSWSHCHAHQSYTYLHKGCTVITLRIILKSRTYRTKFSLHLWAT